jgi:hypothetical protein
VTHCGEVMYENIFSADRAQVEVWAKRAAECAVFSFRERIGGSISKNVPRGT